jgi:uncharacterized protein (DUF4415 family)
MAKMKPNPSLVSRDNPEWTDADFARAKPLAAVLPEMAAEARKVGRPRSEHPKVAISLRLDPDVVEAYKATGRGWQVQINKVLRASMPKPQAPGRKRA